MQLLSHQCPLSYINTWKQTPNEHGIVLFGTRKLAALAVHNANYTGQCFDNYRLMTCMTDHKTGRCATLHQIKLTLAMFLSSIYGIHVDKKNRGSEESMDELRIGVEESLKRKLLRCSLKWPGHVDRMGNEK